MQNNYLKEDKFDVFEDSRNLEGCAKLCLRKMQTHSKYIVF